MNIYILAPSACVEREQIELAQKYLLEFGVSITLSPNLYKQHRYLAGSVAERIADLKQAALDPSIDAIWCARGGTGAAQLLPHLDQWILNKPLLGYSDSTVLLNYIAAQGGTALHAPVFQEIACKNTNEGLISSDAQEALALLTPLFSEQKNHYPLQSTDNSINETDIIQGKVLGGNLTTLCSLQGTPWSLELKENSLLLIEDVGESYYRLERLFVQLLQSTDTQYLRAVVMGDFYQCPQKNVPHRLEHIFREHLDPLNIPLFKADWFGHGHHNRPFWIGGTGTVDHHQLSISH